MLAVVAGVAGEEVELVRELGGSIPSLVPKAAVASDLIAFCFSILASKFVML